MVSCVCLVGLAISDVCAPAVYNVYCVCCAVVACCVCLTELAISDVAALEMVQLNAIYSLGMLVLPQRNKSTPGRGKSVELLQVLL